MYLDILSLLGLNLTDFHVSHDILFTVSSLFLLYCLGYVFNLISSLLDRFFDLKR